MASSKACSCFIYKMVSFCLRPTDSGFAEVARPLMSDRSALVNKTGDIGIDLDYPWFSISEQTR
jgi:hypothetical protein